MAKSSKKCKKSAKTKKIVKQSNKVSGGRSPSIKSKDSKVKKIIKYLKKSKK